MIDATTYATERAICDKARAYWQANATFSESGWSSMTPELAAHPDYAACTNDMRGRVEEYELHRDKPVTFTAYVKDDNARTYITTWTGIRIGEVSYSGPAHTNNFGASWRQLTVRSAWGMTYTGRYHFDAQQCVNLRQVKG